MNLKRTRSFYFLLLGVLCVMAFQNCQKPQFSVDQEQKEKVLQEEQVFTPPAVTNVPSVANVTTTTIRLGSTTSTTLKLPTANISSGGKSLILFNGLQCDQRNQGHKGGLFDPIVVSGVKPLLTMVDTQSGIEACRLEGEAFISAMAGHGFYLPENRCGFVEGRTYTLDISAHLVDGSQVRMVGSGTLHGGGVSTDKLNPVKVVYSSHVFKTVDGNDAGPYIGYYGYWQSKEICDRDVTNTSFASPLVIDLGPQENASATIQISSLIDGIFFDILGRNAKPYAHAKKKIGWTSNPRYAFLVLPTAHGQVLGIDQMFGDNTYGPDSQFAANGFLALAKYDGSDSSGKVKISQPDGLISAEDDIYVSLRLWTDLNYNGYAEHSELKTLAAAGIDFIDLNYDGSYRERDSHGNETTYKSIVKKTDGKYHLIFDLWFVYSDR